MMLFISTLLFGVSVLFLCWIEKKIYYTFSTPKMHSLDAGINQMSPYREISTSLQRVNLQEESTLFGSRDLQHAVKIACKRNQESIRSPLSRVEKFFWLLACI